MYLASGQDAFAVGTQLGMSAGNTYTFQYQDVSAFQGAMGKMSASASAYRSMSTNDVDFKTKSKKLIEEDDKDQNSGTITTTGTITGIDSNNVSTTGTLTLGNSTIK